MLKRLHLILLVVQLFAFLTAKAYYDPSTRSFLSRDPYREGGGTNHYAYCFNRPFQYVDPAGAAPVELGGRVINGRPQVLMEDWSNPLGYIFGGTRTWLQDPTPNQLTRLFRSENGELRVADYSERHDVFWQQYDPASKIAAAQAAATSSAVAKMTYGPLALVSGWGALAEGGVTVGTVLFAGHEGYAGGSMLLGLFTGEDYAISPEGLFASNMGASDNEVAAVDAIVSMGSPFMVGSGPRIAPLGPRWNPMNYRVPAGELFSGIPRLKYILPTSSNYRLRYLQADPNLPANWAVHHSIPQKYRELFSVVGIDIDDLQFLRGVSPDIHSKITTEWMRFDMQSGGNPNAAEVARFMQYIDHKYEKHLRVPGF
jgi:hypothetical protein